MTHDEMIDVIKAHRDGKQIQVRPHSFSDWSDNVYPVWDFDHCDYRIKPEEPAKQKYELLPIEECGGYLRADGTLLCDWISDKRFVGFIYDDKIVRPWPVHYADQYGTFRTIDTEDKCEVRRATHVVVEAR